MELRKRAWLSTALFTITFMALANCATAQTSALDERMKKVLADPAATAAAITAAKKVTFFCDACHGAEGSSSKVDVPNLAGQNPSYLLIQIDKFARGLRHYSFMEGLMKLLSESDRINVTIFYSSKQVKPAGTETSRAGQAIYTGRCIMCHGPQGYGNEATPRLAGQQIKYLSQSIMRYRDRSGERIYEPMSASTSGLKERDIVALTTYLSSLH
ncbi:MAG: c-type cytochrome [Pseudomonadota bacterium]